MIPLVLSSCTPLACYFSKCVTFIMSFHTLKHLQVTSNIYSQAPEHKSYPLFHAPHPSLHNKLAAACLFNFCIHYSPSLCPTDYSAIQLQNVLISKLSFFSRSLFPLYKMFSLSFVLFQSHSCASELPTNTYCNLNAVVIFKILTTDQYGH